MNEKPILFSGPMVRALLSGTKTQTRRIIKPQPSKAAEALYNGMICAHELECSETGGYLGFGFEDDECLWQCPYGAPGKRLWVRETWARDDEDGQLMYRADLGQCQNADAWEQNRMEGVPRYRWRPGIHIPRWASRIDLLIKRVWVERLQDISTHDAWAEGIAASPDVDPVHEYRDLWEQINGAGSWDANPFVWCIEFERVKP